MTGRMDVIFDPATFWLARIVEIESRNSWLFISTLLGLVLGTHDDEASLLLAGLPQRIVRKWIKTRPESGGGIVRVERKDDERAMSFYDLAEYIIRRSRVNE